MTADASHPAYRGRFAPSPTGPLHFGSLVAAAASYLQARANDGVWLVRMEDIDPPREVPGAAAEILHTLERFGFEWDEPVVFQSARMEAYDEAVARLRAAGAVYPCACSRREIADSSVAGIDGPVYPGACRGGLPPGRRERAVRVRTDNAPISFDDRWQGRVTCMLGRDIGDFVVRRADGYIAYQLAVVVDDAAQWISEVVRGVDLLYSTPRQVHLQRLLGLATPSYAHLPVAVNDAGEKLSKQTGAPPITHAPPVPLLRRALAFLGQDMPPADCDVAGLWRFAIAHWRPERVPRTRFVPARTA